MDWKQSIIKGALIMQTVIIIFRALATIAAAVTELRAAAAADPALKPKLDAAHDALKAVADHPTE